MNTTHPVAARYLEQLDRALAALGPDERREIVREIDNHIADALRAGRPIDEVLQALGPAEALAKAYTVESLLNPRSKAPRSDRWLRLLGFLAIAGLPSFIVIVTLFAFGVSMTLSGIAVFVASLLVMTGVVWIDINPHPIAGALLGLPIAALGVLAIWGLVAYVRFITRLAKQMLARART